MRLIQSLKTKDKTRAKKYIKKVIELRENELRLLEKLFTNPIKKNIENGKKCLKSEISIEQFMETNKKLSKHLQQFYQAIQEDKKIMKE